MSCDGGEVFNRAVQQCGDLYPDARDGSIKSLINTLFFTSLICFPLIYPPTKIRSVCGVQRLVHKNALAQPIFAKSHKLQCNVAIFTKSLL